MTIIERDQIERWRAEIKSVYSGKWIARCDRMSAQQVYAIYKSFRERGLLK